MKQWRDGGNEREGERQEGTKEEYKTQKQEKVINKINSEERKDGGMMKKRETGKMVKGRRNHKAEKKE